MISLARVLLRMSHWPLLAANELGVTVKSANQYERAWYYDAVQHSFKN